LYCVDSDLCALAAASRNGEIKPIKALPLPTAISGLSFAKIQNRSKKGTTDLGFGSFLPELSGL
jgi:hypothetical protein